MAQWRFKTKEEFIRDGLWCDIYDTPNGWGIGNFNNYLGKTVTDEEYRKNNFVFFATDSYFTQDPLPNQPKFKVGNRVRVKASDQDVFNAGFRNREGSFVKCHLHGDIYQISDINIYDGIIYYAMNGENKENCIAEYMLELVEDVPEKPKTPKMLFDTDVTCVPCTQKDIEEIVELAIECGVEVYEHTVKSYKNGVYKYVYWNLKEKEILRRDTVIGKELTPQQFKEAILKFAGRTIEPSKPKVLFDALTVCRDCTHEQIIELFDLAIENNVPICKSDKEQYKHLSRIRQYPQITWDGDQINLLERANHYKPVSFDEFKQAILRFGGKIGFIDSDIVSNSASFAIVGSINPDSPSKLIKFFKQPQPTTVSKPKQIKLIKTIKTI